MPQLTSSLLIKLIDGVSAPARGVNRALNGIGKAVDEVNGRRFNIATKVNQLTTDLKTAFDKLGKQMDKAGRLSVPLMFAGGYGARAAYEFQKIGNAVQATTDITDEQRAKLEAYTTQLNAAFPYTNQEIMSAAFELARAGFSFEQMMGALKGTLDLGLSGDIELQQAADIATNVMTAMGLKMKTAEDAAASLAKVVDTISYAANQSNTDVRLMGETFKYVAPIARAAGLSVDDVAAAAMILANNGIKGAEAGVAMRSALVRMYRPTKPMLVALEGLNLDLRDFVKQARVVDANSIVRMLAVDGIDANPAAKAIQAILDDPTFQSSPALLTQAITETLADSLGTNSVVDRDKLSEAISTALTIAGSEVDFLGFIKALQDRGASAGEMATLFDQRQGTRLLTLLFGDLIAKSEEVTDKAAGSAAKSSEARQKGIVGSWNRLESSWENLFISIAKSGVIDTVASVMDSITSMLDTIAASNPTLLKFGTYALMGLAVLAPLGYILGGIVGLFAAIATSCGIIGTASAGVVAVFRAAAAVAGGTAAGAAGSGAAGAAAGGVLAKGGSMWSKLLKGAGWIGLAISANEALDTVDPEGNFWGLTSGIDKWVEENFGFNPSKIQIGGGGAPGVVDQSTVDRTRAAKDAWANNPDRLMMERFRTAPGAPQADASRQAGAQAGQAFKEGMDQSMDELLARGLEVARQLQSAFSFTATPRINTPAAAGAIRGVQSDTGLGVE